MDAQCDQGEDFLLRRSVSAFCDLRRASFENEAIRYNRVVSGMHDLCAMVDQALMAGADSQVVRSIIQPAVELQATSPFISRLQSWPRGYHGDFETIEYLVAAINRAPLGTVGHACEQYALNTAIAYQHRNKLLAQSGRVCDVINRNASARILVLAAGGARDLMLAGPALKASRATIVLNDIDSDALVMAQERLAFLGDRMQPILGNAFECMEEFKAEGPYDLIVAGGLFDYIPAAIIRRYFPVVVTKLLKDDGRLFFTNIGDHNPYRSWMEYFANWKLFHRSFNEVEGICSRRRGDVGKIRIELDPTGLTYLVDVKR